MKRNSMMARRAAMSAFVVAATVLTTGVMTTASFAQQNGGGFGGGNGGGRRGGGQGRGGMQATVGTTPVSALAVGLKLTDDQKTKIEAAQKPYMDLQKSMMPAPGQQMDRTAMQANFQKMGEARTKADADVNAILTDEQKTMAPEFLKKLGELRAAGIQPGVYGDLKLSGDQETQIIDISTKAQRKMREDMQAMQGGDRQAMMDAYQASMKDTKTKVEAVLNASQKQTLEEYDKAHPQRMGGMMGGGRNGGGGRRGGAAGGGGAAPAGGGNL